MDRAMPRSVRLLRRRIARPVITVIRQRAAMRRIGEARKQLTDDSGRLASALAMMQSSQPDDVRAWVAKIETRRRVLESSEELVEFGLPHKRVDVLGNVVARASKSAVWGLLLLHLVRTFRPARALEIGTAFGLSAAYQAAGLALNGSGGLVTIEGDPGRAARAELMLHELGLGRHVQVRAGSFESELPKVLSAGTIGMAFVDGNHHLAPTLAYFEQIVAASEPPSVLAFDDIAWSVDMRRAWRTIAADERVDIAVDLGALGVCTLR